MTKKDYKELVNYINHINALIYDICMFHKLPGNVKDDLLQVVIKATRVSLIPYLQKDNPKFEVNKFYKEII